MIRPDTASTSPVDPIYKLKHSGRSFHLQGFTQQDRPEGKQTGQIVMGYLEWLGLAEAEQIDQADILIIREDVSAELDPALLLEFGGREVWVVNSRAGLHQGYGRYRNKKVRHVPLPVMLSVIARHLAQGADASAQIPIIPKTTESPTTGPLQGLVEDLGGSLDNQRLRAKPWVLVVDDNIINRKILARNLAGMVSCSTDDD